MSLAITMISAGTIMQALRHRHLVKVLHPVPKLLVARVVVAASESQGRGGNLDFLPAVRIIRAVVFRSRPSISGISPRWQGLNSYSLTKTRVWTSSRNASSE